jgi:hypothetical protein
MATKAELFRDHAKRSGAKRTAASVSSDTPAGSPSGEDAALAAEVVRLTNRTALLTVAAAFAIVATLVAVPRALFAGMTGVAGLAAAVPVAAAIVAVIAVWRSRLRLRAARVQALTGPGRAKRP